MMTSENYYKEISNVIHISNADLKKCEFCDFQIYPDMLDSSVNHYIKEHDYKLLHVGQETKEEDDKPWHQTVAVIGK